MGGDTSQLRPYRPIMVLAGKAASGKSNILEMCGRFLGYQGEKLISYPSLNNAKNLAEMFDAEKVSPILVDELSTRFFTGNTGERETKRIANELYHAHPCMITATNADDFFVKSQLENRMYVLFIQNQFDEKRKKESIETLNRIKESVTPFLFYDFSKRMADFLHSKDNLDYILDPLQPARELFLSYYQELDLAVPEFFPHSPFSDYFSRGSEVWRNLYDFKREHFQSEKEFIIIHPLIAERKEDREKLLAFIPGHMIVENVGVYKLRKDSFLEFIGIKKGRWFDNWFK
jgi:hypothetical protein